MRRLRIFLCSPSDVSAERQIAMEVIDRLNNIALIHDKFLLEVVAWDKPGAGTPLRATMSPQEAISQGLAKPSDCDIVIVIMWARMGTPLPHPEFQKADGRPFLSGTEWEYEDAIAGYRQSKRPDVLVYRRKEAPDVKLDDPQLTQKLEQYDKVKVFFKQFHDTTTGAALGGYNEYVSPEDFRKILEEHLSSLIKPMVDRLQSDGTRPSEKPEHWQSSPFPGLRAFEETETLIFEGRGKEIDSLEVISKQERRTSKLRR